MSFVSVILCDNFITVMADSRAVELYTNGDVHRVLNENQEKIILLSDKVFMTITGIVEDAQDFIVKSNLIQTVLENGKLKDKGELEIWFKTSQQYIVTDHHFTVSFGGLTTGNDLKVYFIDSNKKILEQLTYGENEIGYKLTHSPYIDKDFTLRLFKELYQFYDGTPESMLRVQAMLNDKIADLDISVNKNKKSFWLKRI